MNSQESLRELDYFCAKSVMDDISGTLLICGGMLAGAVIGIIFVVLVAKWLKML